MVPRRRLELPRPKRSLAPEASASTNSATWAHAHRMTLSHMSHGVLARPAGEFIVSEEGFIQFQRPKVNSFF